MIPEQSCLAAQAWCADENREKVMDVDLAEAFARILVRETQQPGPPDDFEPYPTGGTTEFRDNRFVDCQAAIDACSLGVVALPAPQPPFDDFTQGKVDQHPFHPGHPLYADPWSNHAADDPPAPDAVVPAAAPPRSSPSGGADSVSARGHS